MSCAGLGLKQGDRVTTMMPNGPEAAVAYFGFSQFCTYAPLNPKLTDAELSFEFEDLPAVACVLLRNEPSGMPQAVAQRLAVPLIELSPDKQTCGLYTIGCARVPRW